MPKKLGSFPRPNTWAFPWAIWPTWTELFWKKTTASKEIRQLSAYVVVGSGLWWPKSISQTWDSTLSPFMVEFSRTLHPLWEDPALSSWDSKFPKTTVEITNTADNNSATDRKISDNLSSSFQTKVQNLTMVANHQNLLASTASNSVQKASMSCSEFGQVFFDTSNSQPVNHRLLVTYHRTSGYLR